MRFHRGVDRESAIRRSSQLALALMIILSPLPGHWVLWKRSFGEIYYEVTSLALYPFDAANALFLMAAFLWIDWRKAPGLAERRFTYPLVLLVLLAGVSGAWAFDLLLALQMAVRLLILLSSILLIIRVRPGQRLIQASLLCTLLIQAGAAVAQFWRQDDLGQRWLGELDLNRYPGGGSILSAGEQYWLRAYGFTSHPNILGGLLVMYILILTVPMLQSGGRQKPLWLLALLAGIAGLFVTFSRAAWLGGAAGGLFLALAILWHRPWRQAHGRTLALFGLAGGLLLGGLGWSQRPLLSARFSASGSDLELRSIDERAALNQAGRELVRLAPLTGVGANNATVALSPLVKGLPGVSAQPIHNLLLLVTAELGIGGGLLWLWLTVAPAWMTLGRLRQGTLSLWALGLAAALVAFAVIDLFDYYAWIWMSGRSWRWLLWGLWLVALRQGDSSRRPGG